MLFGPYESKPRAGPYQARRLASFAIRRRSCWKASMCKNQSGSAGPEVFLDGLTYNWLTQALSHWLFPSFGEVIRNRTSGKSYAEEKCKIGKDEDFGSERCTDWSSGSPAAVYWAQSGWERGFSMLSMLWSSQLPSLGSKTVEGSIHRIGLSISTALTCTFHLVHRPYESDLALYCPLRKRQTTPLRLSNLIDLTDFPTQYGRTLDWLWNWVFWLGLVY